MNFRKGIIQTLALLLVAVPLLVAYSNEAQAATSRVAIIKELTGTVQVQKSGGSKQFKAFARMSLNEGDVLTTGSSSTAVLQFANGSSEDDKLSVSANTTLTFSKLSDRNGTRTKVSMFNGTAWVDVKSITSKNDEFTLETPTAVMGVRGTHLLVNVDPTTGSTRLSVAAGIVSTSTAGSTEPRNVLPNQDALLTQGDGDVTIAPTDLELLMAQADKSIIEAIIKAAGDIVKENEEKKSQYVEQSGLQSPEDQARLKSNVENLLGAIVDTAVKSGLISEDRANQLVKESQSQTGVTVDLSKKEITLSDEEKLQQEQQKKRDEDAKKTAEEQKKQQAEERKKSGELLKKLDEYRKKKEEANKQALEDMKAKNEADYLKKLDDAAQQRFQGDQKNLGQEQQSSPTPTPISTPTPSPTTYYSVSFNSNGGSGVSSISVVGNALVTEPAAPTKTGYTFAGWYSDGNLTTDFSFTTPIAADTTLYAKWNINSYTVSFDGNGGSAIADQAVNYNGTATLPAVAPTKTGYTFAGWYSDSELTTAFSFTTPITADTTLYAKWNINSYTVSFDSNGGSAVADQTVDYNGVTTLPAAPTKTGYKFTGWYSDSGLNTAFLFTTPITADTTLYAKWNINNYTVSFDSNGGSAVADQAVNYNGTATLPAAPTKTGYTFAGWYSDGNLTTVFPFTTLITANTTLYAKWNINSYTVSFDSNGGSAIANQAVNYNGTATLPAVAPTKTGYTFAGWYSDNELTTAFLFTTPITADTTLYAKWNINSYTVSFNSNGGTSVADQTVDYNGTATLPVAAPTKTGYTFAGWYSDNELTTAFLFTTPITADTTLYAKWNINNYTVSFDSNGGSAVADQAVNYNGTATLPAVAPTKTGYTFAGWYSDSGLNTAFLFTTPITADTTLYAKWNINSYTVSFDSNGGSAVADQTVNYNGMATLPAVAPTKVGYTFAGWYSDGNLTTVFPFTTLITANTTLYAKWNINSYTVSFNSNGGSAVADQAVNYNGTATLPAVAPTKPGYTFAGWYSDSGLNTVFSFTTPITADTTLYAKWSINIYTVSFNSNGGSAVADQAVNYNGAATLPAAPTKSGYTFAGWYSDSGLTTTFSFQTTSITADTTLYAKWNINSYTVSFNSNGGSAVADQAVNYNTKANEPTVPTKTGYTFAGWYSDSGLTTDYLFTTPIIADTTLYAKWSINTYTVSFNSNGGSAVVDQAVDYNGVATLPAAPTKTGYTFAGWYSDGNLTTVFPFTTLITANTTLYAKWSVNTYTVSFNSNGGSAVADQAVDYNGAATLPAAPTKSGYTFAGWYSDGNLTTVFPFTTPIMADTTLYAKWNINTYTVSFNSNGGSAVADQAVDYNGTASEPSEPTKTGYTFAGWYSDSGLNTVFSFTTLITADTTLYAKWNINSYTVSFNSNGGSAVADQAVDYNGTASEPSEPTKTGYTFAGWYSDGNLTTVFPFTTPIMADTTLYAKWNINTYTVSFNSNGGSAVADQAVNYNGTATLPAAPTKSGYTFAGWYSDSELATTFSFQTTPITADTTLYAKWNINTYTVSFNSNGGSAIADQTVDYNGAATLPAAPTKSGYTFAGWYSDGNLTTVFPFTTLITANTTLYAKWNINSYTVSFNSNGGSAVASQTVNENGTASQPSDPTKDEFVFDSWYKDSGLTQPFSFTTPITDNMTLYAKWIPIGPLVNLALYATADASDSYPGYDPHAINDGVLGTDWAIRDSTVEKWIKLSWNVPQHISHIKLYDRVHIPDQILSGTLTFSDGTSIEVGALPNNGLVPGEFIFPAKTVTWVKLTINDSTTNPGLAEFEVYDDIYTVSFNSNGGSAVASQLVNYNETVTPRPSDPTLVGYEFAGWYKDSDLIQPFEFQATPITGNVTLYAKWTLILNAFVNEGFESPVLSNFAYVPSAPGWTFTGYSGIAPNRSGFGNTDAPEGTQAAILQMGSSFSQTVTFSAGTYNISFYAAQRGGNHQNFDVYVDSALIGNFTPVSSAFNAYTTDIFTVPAGPHTVTFLGKTSPDNTAFIDEIKVHEASASSVATGITSITPPASGATGLSLPIVPSGYTIAIYSSSNIGVIGTNGAIAPPAASANVDLVFRITRTSDNSTADTGTITVTVPAGQLQNIAKEKIPSSNGYPIPSVMTDGDLSVWADGGSGLMWVVLDLGASYNLEAVKLWHYYEDSRIYHDVIVQLSNTSDFASGVTTVFNNDTDNSAGQGTGTDTEYAESSTGKIIAFSPVNARYVRLWSNGNSKNTANHIIEIEVYGN